MFQVVVTDHGGQQSRIECSGQKDISVGRMPGNDVVLPKNNVSKRHARIVLEGGKFIIIDLKSANGTYVNGRKISGPLVITRQDKIHIGDFVLQLEER